MNALQRRATALLAFCLACVAPLLAQDPALDNYDRLSAEERRMPEWAVAGLDAAAGLEVGLFASEPMLLSPTNIDIDHRGRVWVLEAVNYRAFRNPDNPKRPEGDRILILEDTTGDGRADEHTVFYQGTDINAALGIAVLGDRVVVSASPHVFVFTDQDGDDHADTKEVLFQGVGGEDHDHGMHAVVFGPDGKFYFNFGNSGKQILNRDGNVVVDAAGHRVEEGSTYRQGMVFRSNPDGSAFEVLGHNFRNNYEVAVDAFGTMWQSDNDDDGNRSVRINYVMEYGNFGYVDERTGAGWRADRTNKEELVPDQHWHQNDPGVVPNVLHTGAGSPTGLVVYEGSVLPEVYRNQMIHADAGPNVVRAYPVERDGAGYTASIVDVVKGTRDRRFRPSDVAVAPDGSLFIADWYDPVVGGHEMADDVGRGRIFRVAPPDTPYRIPPYDFDTAEGLTEALTNPNPATRHLAWVRLHELQDDAEPALVDLWRSENPRHRARALWLLTKIEGRGDHYVREALEDDDPNLRITALRAARQLGTNLVPYLRDVVDDPSAQVRREAAIALREVDAPEAAGLWAELSEQHDGEDRWYLEALGTGAEGRWDRFFTAWLDRTGPQWNTPAGRDIVWRARTAEALPYLAELIMDEDTGEAERLRYFRAFDFHEDASKDGVLLDILAKAHPEQAEMRGLALKHVDNVEVVSDPAVHSVLEETVDALRGTKMFVDLVARFDLKNRNEELVRMIVDEPDGELALSAVRQLVRLDGAPTIERALADGESRNALALVTALGRFDDAASKDLLERFVLDETLDIGVRRAAVRGLGTGWGGETRLLEMVESGRLPSELHAAAADVLLRASRGPIRNAAAEHLEQSAADQQTELAPISDLSARSGDPASGRAVFERACQSCHVVNGTGVSFGPELSEIGTKLPKEALYLAIVDPNAGINFGYEAHVVTLREGGETVGFIQSETDDAVELRVQSGATQRYERSDIASITRLDTSLMPEELHRAMTEQELVDLVEYLTTLREAE